MSQCERVMAVLKDGQPHTIQEIHQRAGTMRLNSRIAELRKRMRLTAMIGGTVYHRKTIACWTAKVDGQQTWVYQLVALPEPGGAAETPALPGSGSADDGGAPTTLVVDGPGAGSGEVAHPGHSQVEDGTPDPADESCLTAGRPGVSKAVTAMRGTPGQLSFEAA